MEPHPQLDTLGASSAPRLIFSLLLLLILPACAAAQSAPAAPNIAEVQRLYKAGRWEAIVQAVPESTDQPAELELYRGLALAQLHRWDDARKSFQAGIAHHPRDERLLVELAGVEYRLRQRPLAKRYLRRALSIEPHDAYANNFLATIYFLDGNLEAALKYWNRVNKPRLDDLSYSPQPSLDPLILDRAFDFSRGGVWSTDQYLSTKARLDALNLFPQLQFDLQSRSGSSFNLVFRTAERPSWTQNYPVNLFMLLRGLPFETVYPEFYNIHHAGLNFVSLLRWNDQHRRLSADLAAPLFRNPSIRYRLYFEARDENWNVTNTIVPSFPSDARFNLERVAAGGQLRFIEGGRWQWNAGVEFTDRIFRTLVGIPATAAPFFTDGSSIALSSGVQRSLIRVPERRFTLDGRVVGQFGTFFDNSLGRYGRLQSSLTADWFPQARADDYHLRARLSAGSIFGQVPVDDLFVLGFDRDTDLWLRGHRVLHHSQPGNAPLGRDYVLSNWDFDKIVYDHPFFTIAVGPFLDTGDVYDSSQFFGSPKWLWDTGLQTKIRVLGHSQIILGYGADLRSGHIHFFAAISR
jgi:tetratricopeptide (TPR) repeat protein